mmetsp:Transcript_24398/g.35840  ORF Transcript_24398/g.35840 Transcript_24398/m.35840 type:complete len:302 (+) Transcript_24398:220-1125(+)|eukprot:CAMPEP_0185030474 /NCGR_PEP_ID=MMETSP1103-20130426/17470_1 /TAXON_ID=36769 /ORGANISM="Paraphysomonas bandaiensis, Strain Caron Lab Isolate" /LENGTH=301 /DNA_ID=CAMNT_0027565631 /DNA_START=157 /DNA_END=1062 /DNA_ORIENTATION=-
MADISEAEKLFVKHSCSLGVRNDGRNTTDFRSIAVETDIFPHCNGSSRVSIGNSIDVVCGVKVVVTELSGKSDDMYINVTVELPPSASNNRLDEKRQQEVSSYISDSIKSAILQSCNQILPGQLDIIPGKFCWTIHADIQVLETDSACPIDPCSWAAYAALRCTTIPGTEVFSGETGVAEDFDVTGDAADASAFDPGSRLPICITITKIQAGCLLLDPSLEEEACAECTVTIAVCGDGVCCGIKKLGGAGSLSVAEITTCLQNAQLAAQSMFPQLDNICAVTKEEDAMHPDRPPVRVGLLA